MGRSREPDGAGPGRTKPRWPHRGLIAGDGATSAIGVPGDRYRDKLFPSPLFGSMA